MDPDKVVYHASPDERTKMAVRTLTGSGLVTSCSPFKQLPDERCYAYENREGDSRRTVISPAYEGDKAKVIAVQPPPRAQDPSKDVRTGSIHFSLDGYNFALSEKHRARE